jgi:hypothetical protein
VLDDAFEFDSRVEELSGVSFSLLVKDREGEEDSGSNWGLLVEAVNKFVRNEVAVLFNWLIFRLSRVARTSDEVLRRKGSFFDTVTL